MKVLEDLKVQKEMDRELLISVARTALRTKVAQKLADQLAEVGTAVFDYLLAVPYLYY